MGIKERELIKTSVSGFSMQHDVLVRLIRAVADLNVEIGYIPDRYLLDRESLASWLDSYRKWDKTPEELVLNLVDDLNNEVVPKWVCVSCQLDNDETIVVEDQQPHWLGSPLVNRFVIR